MWFALIGFSLANSDVTIDDFDNNDEVVVTLDGVSGGYEVEVDADNSIDVLYCTMDIPGEGLDTVNECDGVFGVDDEDQDFVMYLRSNQ
jgi:hypothetical protein